MKRKPGWETLKLRCYMCGGDIENRAVLWSLRQLVDQVFAAHERCIGRAADNPLTVTVKLLPKRRKGEKK